MVFAAAATAALTGAYPAQAASGLRAPGLQSPPNRASLQSLPAFQWAVVPGAGSYELTVSGYVGRDHGRTAGDRLRHRDGEPLDQ